MARQKSDSTPKAALLDMAAELKKVFHRHSKSARTRAWEKLTHGDGEKQMKYLLVHPDHSLNTFHRISFKEWLDWREENELSG